MGSKQLGISDIAIFVGTFCPHNVGFIRTHMHAHTHTIWRCLLYMHCNSLSEAIWLLFLLLINWFQVCFSFTQPNTLYKAFIYEVRPIRADSDISDSIRGLFVFTVNIDSNCGRPA